MRRREFILGGAIALTPFAARAQQSGRMPHVGILVGSPENPAFRMRIGAFMDRFRELGWVDGKNVKIDLRWYPGDAQKLAAQAHDLVRSKPDVIVAGPTNALLPVKKETRTIPIVFTNVSDPLGQGIVDSLARPTGNVTGFSNLEFSLIGKWLQILKETAPGITRVGLMIGVTNASSASWYRVFNEVAPSFSIEPVALPVNDRAAVERGVKSLSRPGADALIVAGDSFVESPDITALIVEMTATYRVPALYGVLPFANVGGLICYGIDQTEPYQGAASYVDRILKGAKPADLPVQQPRKFRFILNLKTAKALGLEPSTTLVASADEVIE